MKKVRVVVTTTPVSGKTREVFDNVGNPVKPGDSISFHYEPRWPWSNREVVGYLDGGTSTRAIRVGHQMASYGGGVMHKKRYRVAGISGLRKMTVVEPEL